MSTDDKVRLAHARVGQLFDGKWHLAHLLGVGGTAAVYAARHRNASVAAVKILHPTLSHDDVLCARFLREGYVANTVAHAGAVRVLDDDTADDGSVYLVMELLEGETLDARARRKDGRLPLTEVLSLTDQLLDVLGAAHAKGILHRDVKPENLFLTVDGQLKVLDFGIARLGGASTSATITGTALGTPAFMAPEMALGKQERVDARTDLWAVGATMFNLLTGRFVQEGDTANEVLVRAATTRVVPVRSLAPELPEGLAAIVDRALSFESASRWPDAASFQAAVREAYYALDGRPSGGPPPLPRTVAGDLPHPAAPTDAEPGVVEADADEDVTELSRTVTTEEASAAPVARSDRPSTATVASVTRTTGAPRARRRPAVVGGVVVAVAIAVALLLFARRGHAPAPPVTASPAVSGPSPSAATSAPQSPRSVSIDDLEVASAAPSASEAPAEAPTKAEPRRPAHRVTRPQLTQPDF